MLSDIDVHYLVGLLTRAQEADDVAVELGDMVLDTASGKKRDVDITAIYTDKDGTRSAYKGIEVKNHKTRPLTVEHVEQLCLKLNDMPDITHRAIVSASGYTKGAVNKAHAHKVDLLEIIDWEDPGEGFNVKFDPKAFKIVEPIWTKGPHVVVDVSADNYQEAVAAMGDNPEICDKSGSPMANVPNVEALSITAHKNVSTNLTKQIDQTKVQDGDKVDVDKIVRFTDEPCIKLDTKIIPITDCCVTGTITYKVHATPMFKVLRDYNNNKELIAGCIIVETGDNSLMGISVNNLTRKITYLNIPHADRLRKKIKGYRLTLSHTTNTDEAE